MATLRPELDAVLAEWGARVKANREQVERFQEEAPRADHYAPLVENFRVDPRRAGDPVLDVLAEWARPDEVWLDVGSGAGRYALPLALRTREVIALDSSPGMLDGLRRSMAEHGIANVRPVQARWPLGDPPRADVAFIANVGYDIEAIGPFLDAMEAAAPRCVAVLRWQRPTWAADALWPAVHGVERARLLALPEFLTLLLARGRRFELRTVELPPQTYPSVEAALQFGRIQTWVRPGGEKDARLQAALRARLSERDGQFAFRWEPIPVGVVAWQPQATIPSDGDGSI